MKTLLPLLFLAWFAPLTAAQGSAADYERAANLSSERRDKLYRSGLRPVWVDEHRLWYQVKTGAGTRELVQIDAEAPAGERRTVLATNAELGQALGLEAEQVDVLRIHFEGEDEVQLLLEGGGLWSWYPSSARATPLDPASAAGFQLPLLQRPRRSRGSIGDTGILIVNRTHEPLTLKWLERDGGRKEYGEVSPGGSRWQPTFAGHVWALVDGKGKDRAVFAGAEEAGIVLLGESPALDDDESDESDEAHEKRGEESARPRKRFTAFHRDHDVWLRDRETRDEHRVTDDGTKEDGYTSLYWSPDRTRLVVVRKRAGEERKVQFIESAPDDQIQPRLHSQTYAKPGDSIDHERPRLFAVAEDGTTRAIPISEELFPNPYDLSRLRWSKDGSRFTFLYNQRGHEVVRWIAIDGETGAAQAIISEEPDTFVDYAGKLYLHELPETDEAIWMSERSGWNHLYLVDSQTGQVKNAITQGGWVVRGVEGVDETARTALIRVLGLYPDQDPYHVHWARVGLDDGALTPLTEGDGTHELDFSPDGTYYADTYSRVDLAPVVELRQTSDGALICELERADWSPLVASDWTAPQRFVAPGRDGTTDIWGVVYRPTNHDPKKRYPVIESIYAGPHGAHVPKSFAPYREQQELAELGFIVVQIDGMGTNWRSKAFHDVAWKNLGDAGFPDRIAWLRALAAEDASVDLSRVGIYGGSAGGQNALRALLAHGDFYDAAVADCGCHDNRMDKIWWNELWMGWPIGPHYEEQSNVTQAHRLQGQLLLIVGELDRNVDPASTMQVVGALIEADKDFELLVMPGVGHGAAGSAYGKRRSRDFFVRHLLKREPRWE